MSKYTETRVQRFARLMCQAWCNNCVMTDAKNGEHKEKCNSKNCMVYPIAVKTLAKLDVRDGFVSRASQRRGGER